MVLCCVFSFWMRLHEAMDPVCQQGCMQACGHYVIMHNVYLLEFTWTSNETGACLRCDVQEVIPLTLLCRWYCSRGWTIIINKLSFLCLVTGSSLTKWHLTWKWVQSWNVSLKYSRWKKISLIDIYQHLLNVYRDQIVDVIIGRWAR